MIRPRATALFALVSCVAVAFGCGSTRHSASSSTPESTTTSSNEWPTDAALKRCPKVPNGDARAHLALVARAKMNPSAAAVAALDNNSWTELWAVTARMGAEPKDRLWPSGCEQYPESDGSLSLVCRQMHLGSVDVAPEPVGRLACEVCRVGNLTALGKKTRLRSLSLRSTFIKHPHSIRTLTRLTSLSLNETNVTSAAAIATLTDLTSLDLRGTGLHDITGIGSLKKLTSLNLGGGCLADVSSLASLAALRTLRLFAPMVSDLRAIAQLGELRELVLFVSGVERPPVWSGMAKLERLLWRGRGLTSLKGLAELPALRELGIRFHCVPDANVDNFRNLRPKVELDVGVRHRSCR